MTAQPNAHINMKSAPTRSGDGHATARKHLPIAATGTGMTGCGKTTGSLAMIGSHGMNAMATGSATLTGTGMTAGEVNGWMHAVMAKVTAAGGTGTSGAMISTGSTAKLGTTGAAGERPDAKIVPTHLLQSYLASAIRLSVPSASLAWSIFINSLSATFASYFSLSLALFCIQLLRNFYRYSLLNSSNAIIDLSRCSL